VTEHDGKGAETAPERTPLALMSLAALGIVYGDIGTSPLYAFRQCFSEYGGIAANTGNILGIVSLIFWSLILVVSVKYLGFVMRADNRGEGGVMALIALLTVRIRSPRVLAVVVTIGMLGAALLYGDGTITPAISVLSAVEGLRIATPALDPYIVPITVAILVALFAVQRHGTASIGAAFGPVMLLWFVALAAMGVSGIVRYPAVLRAVDPEFAVAFFSDNGFAGFVVLGTVFLAVTGAEALYADMGHFGRKPIRLAWLFVALPGLVLNYFGQAALLIDDPKVGGHTFYELAPGWALYPLVVLATAATVIASQAIITGTFSLTRQAIHLGFVPRMRVIHTAGEEEGQIYLPAVNLLLMAASVGLVLGFRSSGALSTAYGIAVSLDMVLTTLLASLVAVRWGWPVLAVAPLALAALSIDLSYFAANSLKITEGGWYPVTVAAILFTVMATWRQGRKAIIGQIGAVDESFEKAFDDAVDEGLPRVPGTAVFLGADFGSAMQRWVRHADINRVLHEHVVLLSVRTESEPKVGTADRLQITMFAHGAARVVVRYGYMQSPNVPVALRLCERAGLPIDVDDIIYFTGRTSVVPARDRSPFFAWRRALFAFMNRNAASPVDYFHLPADRVMELGLRVEI